MIRVLLWKEWRLQAEVLGAGLLIFAASFPLALAGVYMQGHSPFPWAGAIGGGCVLNQYLLVLICALFGGTVVGRELEQGSVAFLAYLPAPHRAQLQAKLAVGLGAVAAFWLLNLATLTATQLCAGARLEDLAPFLPRMLGVGALSFLAFTVSWLASYFITSALAAAFVGVCAVALCCGGWVLAPGMLPGDLPFFHMLLLPVFVGLAFCALVASAALFLRHGGNSVALRREGDASADQMACMSSARTVAPSPYPSPPQSRGRGNRTGHLTKNYSCGMNVMRMALYSPFAALLWKDLRLSKAMLLAGTAALSLPFLVVAGMSLQGSAPAPNFRVASLIAMVICWVVFPYWAAHIVAVENSTGTTNFLAYLPLPRRGSVASKLVAVGIPAAFLIMVNLFIFFAAQAAIPGHRSLSLDLDWEGLSRDGFLGGAIAYACAAPVAFAISWLAAARLGRPVIAIVLGVLAAPVAMALWAIPSMPEGYFVTHFSAGHTVIGYVLGISFLSAGLIFAGCRPQISGR